MNPGLANETDNERFNPFLNLSRLSYVEISNLTIDNNFMIQTKDHTPSLFTIQWCSHVSIDNLKFQSNWLDSGALSIFVSKHYLPWNEYLNCVAEYSEDLCRWTYDEGITPFDVVLFEIKNWEFTGNKSGRNKSFAGLIIFKAVEWVSINLENITIENNDYIRDSNLIEFRSL